jgi:hypothetical protein
MFSPLSLPSSKDPSTAQLHGQSRFAVLSAFLSNLAALIDRGFGAQLKDMTPMNAAISYNAKRAMGKAANGSTIQYAKLSYSRGIKVSEPLIPSLNSKISRIIEINWQGGSIDKGYTRESDRANFVIYNPDKDDFVIRIHEVRRLAETCSIELPNDYVGDAVHCYMNFESVKAEVSNSLYLGRVEVRP